MNPPPIGINSVAFGLLTNPVSLPTFRLGDITANSELFQIHHRFIAVVTLVRNHFRQPVSGNLFGRLRSVGQFLHLLSDRDQRLLNRRCVAGVRILQRHCRHSPRFHIDGMFRFVCQMGLTIFHFGNLGVGVLRMFPFLVGAFLRSLPIQFCQVFSRRRVRTPWKDNISGVSGPQRRVCPGWLPMLLLAEA